MLRAVLQKENTHTHTHTHQNFCNSLYIAVYMNMNWYSCSIHLVLDCNYMYYYQCISCNIYIYIFYLLSCIHICAKQKKVRKKILFCLKWRAPCGECIHVYLCVCACLSLQERTTDTRRAKLVLSALDKKTRFEALLACIIVCGVKVAVEFVVLLSRFIWNYDCWSELFLEEEIFFIWIWSTLSNFFLNFFIGL